MRTCFRLLICRAVNLSLEHGNSDASCYAYAVLGTIAGPHFGDYQAGFRFGRSSATNWSNDAGLRRFKARTYHGLRNSSCRGRRHVRAGS